MVIYAHIYEIINQPEMHPKHVEVVSLHTLFLEAEQHMSSCYPARCGKKGCKEVVSQSWV